MEEKCIKQNIGDSNKKKNQAELCQQKLVCVSPPVVMTATKRRAAAAPMSQSILSIIQTGCIKPDVPPKFIRSTRPTTDLQDFCIKMNGDAP